MSDYTIYTKDSPILIEEDEAGLSPERVLTAIQQNTQALDAHEDPQSVTDCFNIVRDGIASLRSRVLELAAENADLRAKLDAARVAIEEAPHGDDACYRGCRCWKSAALAQIDTAISPPDTQSKNT